ncbi:unnamed protein product [Prunus armeniaca]
MLQVVLVLAATSAVATTRASARQGGEEDKTAIALPGCKDKCGSLIIPYPFGIGHGCYSRPEFSITCKESSDERVPTTPRLMKTLMIVTNISLEEGDVEIMQLVNRDCYNAQGNLTNDQTRGGLIDKNDSCSGMGCCETKIPPLLNKLSLTVGSYMNHSRVWRFDPCGYAFVVKQGNFTFSNASFQQLYNTTRLPLVLDWQTARDNGTYACKGNSVCIERPTGYICVCNPGFQGNPYLHDCQDINECDKNPCENGKCINTPGNYTCSCYSGYQNVEKIKCIKVPNAKRLKISLGVSLSFSVLVAAILWKYWKNTKHKEKNLRQKYFKENGGQHLKEKLGNKARIFTESEIRDATNDYAVEKEVGRGKYGIVYRGILDTQYVAIKKPQVRAPAPTDQNQINASPTDQKQITPQEQFVNEMTVLYQINHNNVVRLVGCCLDTKTPILVYEFISDGSLHTLIHGKDGEKPSAPLLLATRLKIAAETAGALAYLHHDTFMQIIHRDVKTANILLDKKLTPKLSDFGASSLLVPEDENKKSILVHGSVGYVDPEYLESKSKKPLTEKSDVYSFGVVLAELLTGRKAEENLANDFFAKVERDMLGQILDEKIVEGRHDEEIVKKAADLAKRCLKPRGEERPSMRQVATELQLLVLTMAKDTGILVGSSASAVDITTKTSAERESSMQIMPLGDGQ